MNETHLQQVVVKLEAELLGFMNQYNGANGYLQGLIGGTIQDRYAQYAQFVNIASKNSMDILMPDYGKIEKFMEKEFQINYVRNDEQQTTTE